MSEDPPMCPICGGLHPAGHRDRELEEKLEAVKMWKHGILLKMPFVGSVGHITRYDLNRLDEILHTSNQTIKKGGERW